jgi:uncharacterized protein YceK
VNPWVRFVAGSLLLCLITGQTGCGTVVNLVWGVESENPAAKPRWDTQVYGGIRNDVHGIGEAVQGVEGFWWSALTFFYYTFIDFPLSLAADTLTLPYTIPYVLTRPDPN